MYTAEAFLATYGYESDITARVFGALTDESLTFGDGEGALRGIGDIAWHIATAPAFLLNQCGYTLPQFPFAPPAGYSAASILSTYNDLRQQIFDQTKTKTAEDMNQVYHVFNTYDWNVSTMLHALIVHEVHHRGQLSILMRQAGLVVPGIYGPNYEQTQEMMAKMAGGQ